jgi:hypothetical protein
MADSTRALGSAISHQPSSMRSAAARWDRAGIIASTACAIHCAALPFVAALLPVLGLHHFTDEWVEWSLIGVVAVIGVVGHVSAYVRFHRHAGPAAVFAAGLTLIVATRLTLGDTLVEPAALAIGGLMGAAAHWANIRLCRCCDTCVADADARSLTLSRTPEV